MTKVVIIGGNAVGATLASGLARNGNGQFEIIILEQNKYFSYSNCALPYYLGGSINQEGLIYNDVNSFQKRGITVLNHSQAQIINPDAQTVTYLNLETKQEMTITYDQLILAMGANCALPNSAIDFDQTKITNVKKPEDVFWIEENIYKSSKVAIIGGGFIGIETSWNLAKSGHNVTIFERENQITPNINPTYAQMIHDDAIELGIKIQTNVQKLDLKDYDFVINCAGIAPNSELAVKSGLEMEGKTIKVNTYLQTNFSNIYAGGDLVLTTNQLTNQQEYLPFAWIATNHSKILANNLINSHLIEVPAIILPTIFEGPKRTFGSVGETYWKLREQKRGAWSNISGKFNEIAGNMPENRQMELNLYYNTETRAIIGGEVIGYNKVDKKLDLITLMIRQKITIDELEYIPFSYTPQFNSTIDAFNILSSMAKKKDRRADYKKM